MCVLHGRMTKPVISHTHPRYAKFACGCCDDGLPYDRHQVERHQRWVEFFSVINDAVLDYLTKDICKYILIDKAITRLPRAFPGASFELGLAPMTDGATFVVLTIRYPQIPEDAKQRHDDFYWSFLKSQVNSWIVTFRIADGETCLGSTWPYEPFPFPEQLVRDWEEGGNA